jgi:hypothetical protein
MKTETKASHTPGPWHYDSVWNLITHGQNEIAAIHSGNKANCHLIASAPELLQALQSLLNCPDLNLDDMDHLTLSAIDQANKAISKAEGREYGMKQEVYTWKGKSFV